MAGPWEEFSSSSSESTGPWSDFQGQESAPKKSSLARRVLGDTGVSLLRGAVAVPEAVVGLGNIVSGGLAGKYAEQVGFRPKEAKAALDEMYSPEQKAANQYVQEGDGFVDTFKRAIERPSVIGQSVAESLPLLLPGAAAARGIGAATKVAPYIAGAAGEGLVGAGSAAEQLRQGSEDGTISGKQTLGALASGVGTAGFGALGGKVASSAIGKKLGISDIDTVLAGGASNPASVGLAKRALSGAVSEGVLEELPQSMWEQAAQNYATDKPLGEGVGQAGAMGLLAGTAMGGTFNAMQRGEQRKVIDDAEPAAEETTPVANGLTYQSNPESQENARLDGMIQPADPEPKLPENGPMAAAANVGVDSGATSLRPQGSFSNMSEFANLLDQEQQDVQSRRTGIAHRQALQREVALQDADQRVADQMAKEAAQRRRAVLDQVLSDPTTQNPADRFAAELQRQGFRDSTPTADELATVQRFNDIKAAEPAGPEIEPSLPNELDAEQLGIRSRKGSSGAQSSGRDKVAEVRQLVADGWKISNKTLVSPTGKKRILNTAEHAAAKEATRERNLAAMERYRQSKGKGTPVSTTNVANEETNAPEIEQLAPQAPQANDAQVESQPSTAPQAEGVAQTDTVSVADSDQLQTSVNDAEQPNPIEAIPAAPEMEDYGKRVVRRNKPVSKWTAEEIQDRLARADSGESPISDESRSQLQAALEPLVAVNKEKEAKAAEQAERVKKMQAAKAANKDTFQIGENKDSLDRVSVRDGVVHLGDYPATDYNSGDDITVPDGATKQQVLDALIAGEAVTKKAKVWGKNGPEQSVADRIAELQAERDAMSKSEQRAAEAIQSAMEVAAEEGVAEAEVMAELGVKNEEVGQAERSNQESQVGDDVGSEKPARNGNEERDGDAQGQERKVAADGRVSSEAKQSDSKAMFSRADSSALDTANRRMSKFVDAYLAGELKEGNSQLLGETPTVLQALGKPNLQISMDYATINKVLSGKHRLDVSPETLKQIMDGVYDPAAVFTRANDGALLIANLVAETGNPVAVAIHFRVEGNRMKMHRIASAFEYNRFVSRFSDQAKNLRYVKNEKALIASTTPDTPNWSEVVQKARELGVNVLTEADVVKDYGSRFSFAGRSAATADQFALSNAEKRVEAGDDAEEVRKETGWFKGADGKWRFEIDDSDAKLKKPYHENGMRWGDMWLNQIKAGGSSNVGNMLDHPSLFAAYPSLADIAVSTQKRTGASYYVQEKRIDIGENVPMYDVVSTLLHEIQHGIQRVEGFATGGSYGSAKKIILDVAKKQDEFFNSPEVRAWVAEQDRIIDTIDDGPLLESALQEHAKKRPESNLPSIDLAELPTDVYIRLAGEAEARNVQSRQSMTAEQRRERSPASTQDVSESDVIVVFNGKVMQGAPMPANASRGQGSGMAFRDLQAVVDRVSNGFNNLPKIHVLDSPRGLSDRRDNERTLKEQIEQAGAMDDVEGAHHNGEIYLFASGIASEERAEHVLATHEITHYGLRGTMGKGLDSALQNIWLYNKEIRAKATVLRTQLGLTSNVSAVEEVLAEMKDSDLVKLKGWRKMVQAFRDWAHKAGFDRIAEKLDGLITKGMSDQEKADLFVANMVNAARDWVRNGKPARGYDPGTSMLGDANFSAKKLDVTDTPAFRKWFGDSKVVDADGKPLVVYHGTAGDFSAFDQTRVGENTKHPTASLGIFLTSDPDVTSNFVQARIGSDEENDAINAAGRASRRASAAAGYNSEMEMPVGSEGRKAVAALRLAAYDAANYRNGANVMPVYAVIKNPLRLKWEQWEKAANWMAGTQKEGISDIRTMIDAGNHDGIILPAQGWKEYAGETYIVFRPEQIKSAIGNNGNFGASNPDIRFSRNKSASVDATITEIFDGLAGRGLKKVRAEERLAEHPQAESIRYVQDNILDILEELEGAGTIKINC